ncbi:MAG: AAA family ATPase [Sulfuritalea sp.]|nr:AAA family ATPase [Sulfuritalea sp.]
MQLAPEAQRFSIADLEALSDSANTLLESLRTKMLEPHPRKKAPTFSGGQVAALCGIEATQVPYLAKRGDLPEGSVEGRGKRRVFTLAETREWVAKLSKRPRRPEGARAATIAVVNFKGGSTKTTTTFNLAQGETLLGRRVLLVDLDPQGSATTLTGMLPAAEVFEEHTVGPITYPPLSEAPKDLRYAVQSTYWDGLDIIPAAPHLFNAEIFLPIHSRDPDIHWWSLLDKAIDPLRDEYDVIIFDTAPALSYLAVNAVIAADGLLMPIPPDNLDYASSVAFWSLLSETLGSLKTHRKIEKDFAFMRVLLSRVDSTSVSASIVKDWIIRTYGPYVLTTEIPRSQVSGVGAVQFGTVFDISKYEGAAKTYAKIRDAFDTLVELIDQSIMSTVWGLK